MGSEWRGADCRRLMTDPRRAEPATVERDITPGAQTPWQEMRRSLARQSDTCSMLWPAVSNQRIAKRGLLRDSH